MSKSQADGDQSMDDILASIRKIISDDEPTAPIETAESKAAAASARPVREAGAQGRLDDLSDILEPSPQSSETTPNHTSQTDTSTLIPQPGQRPDPQSLTSRPETTKADTWSFSAESERDEQVSLASKLERLGETREEPEAQANELAAVLSSLDVAPGNTPENDERVGADVVPGMHDQAVAREQTVPRENVGSTNEVGVTPVTTTKPIAEPVPAATTPAAPQIDGDDDSATSQSSESQAQVPTPKTTRDATTGGVVGVATQTGLNTQADQGGVTIAGAVKAPSSAKASGTSTKLSDQDALEAVVIKALEPMLQTWLDQNMPRLVKEHLKARDATNGDGTAS